MSPDNYKLPRAVAPFSLWSANPSKLADFRSTDKLPEIADVVIIGAGFAGASTAYHLIEGGYKGRIVILEARQACSGASGRNGGHLAPSIIENSSYEYRHSEDPFEYENMQCLTTMIRKHDIDCDIIQTGMSDLSNERGFVFFDNMEEFQFYKNGLENGVYEKEMLPSIGIFKESLVGGIRHFATPINPYRLVTWMLNYCLQQGVLLYTHCLVKELDFESYEGCNVHCCQGSIWAKKVISCTNAYTNDLFPFIPIKPVRGQVSRYRVSRSQIKDLPLQEGRISMIFGDEYMSVLPDRNDISGETYDIVLGGCRYAVKNREENLTDDSEVNPIIAEKLDKLFSEILDFNQAPQESWTGIMGFCSLPYIGAVNSSAFLIAGFSGHGMPRIFGSAKALVERYFTSCKRVWPEYFPEKYRTESVFGWNQKREELEKEKEKEKEKKIKENNDIKN